MRFAHLKPGDRVVVSGTHDGLKIRDQHGVVTGQAWSGGPEILVLFDEKFSDDLHIGEGGPDLLSRHWYFEDHFEGYIVREEAPKPAPVEGLSAKDLRVGDIVTRGVWQYDPCATNSYVVSGITSEEVELDHAGFKARYKIRNCHDWVLIDRPSDKPKVAVDMDHEFMIGSHSENQKEGTSMKFLTAWVVGGELTLTQDEYPTEAAAQEGAIELAREEPNTAVVVLKVLTRHRSSLIVTTEAA